MRLHDFRGGVHPPSQKHLSAGRPIESLPLPSRLYIPLQQHAGAPALPVVTVGQRVGKGELLARRRARHPRRFMRPLPGGSPPSANSPRRTLRAAAADHHPRERTARALGRARAAARSLQLSPEEVARRVGAAGIVGMGGANFPAAVKLRQGASGGVHTLVINGAECEPYVTCDDRLMRERAGDIVDGIAIMLHALQAPHAVIAIENNKPEADSRP
jgi:electron transport complex protein RnfC